MSASGNYVEIVVNYHEAGGSAGVKPIVNAYQFLRTAGSGLPTKANIDASFQTTILTPLQACLNTATVHDNDTVRFFDDATDVAQVFTGTKNGTSTGDWLPPHVAATVRMKAAIRLKGYRGSKHYGVISEGDTLNDELNGGAITNFATFMTAWLAGFTVTGGHTYVPMILSRKYSQLKENPTTINQGWTNAQSIPSQLVLNKTLGIMKHRKHKTVI